MHSTEVPHRVFFATKAERYHTFLSREPQKPVLQKALIGILQ
jgi:hypothetical protein